MSESTSLLDFFSGATPPPSHTIPIKQSISNNSINNHKADNNNNSSSSSDNSSPHLTPSNSSENINGNNSKNHTAIHLNNIQWCIDQGSLFHNSPQSNTNFNTSQYIHKQLQLRSSEYTDIKYINIWCGTYNVNAKKPPTSIHDIIQWIGARTRYDNHTATSNEYSKLYRPSDIYVFGFQEIVDLDAKNFIIDHSACKPWQNIIQQALDCISKSNQYTLISTVHLVGLALFIYVRSKLQPWITDIRSTTVGVGLMGVGGNKGAVITRFDIYNSGICFVNTHLAAHQKNVKARNSDYHSICKRAALLPHHVQPIVDDDDAVRNIQNNDPRVGDNDIIQALSSNFAMIKTRVQKVAKDLRARHDENAIDMTSESHSIELDGYGIFDHQHVFWIGDNNYRIDELTLDEVYELIEQSNWQQLLAHEQLQQEKSRGNVFVEFEEGIITFPPTYKYITGTNSYDRKETGKMRIPAYCDRIQWLGDRGVKQRYYMRAECTLSDHKPVMSLFKTPVNIEIESRKILVERELSDITAESAWPSLALSTRIIELGDVQFDIPYQYTLAIKNTGRSVVQYECQHRKHHTVDQYGELTDNNSNAPSDHADNQLPAWLKVTPASGVIRLNSTVVLTVRVRVARKAASLLNMQGDKSLLSLLLIKCINGGYHSIGLRGNYIRTILGTPLAHLCKLNNMPIALTPAQQIRNNKKQCNIPNCIQSLVDYIDRQRPIDTDLLKSTNDVNSDLQSISESADGGQLLNDSMIRSIIHILDNGLPLKQKYDLSIILHALRIILLCLPSPLLSRPPSQPHYHGVSDPLSDEHSKRRDRLRDARHEYTMNQNESVDMHGVPDDNVYDVPTWCYHCMCELNTQQYMTLICIIKLFRSIISDADSKHTTTNNICNTFSPCLTFRPAQSTLSPTIQLKPVQVLRHIIENDDYV